MQASPYTRAMTTRAAFVACMMLGYGGAAHAHPHIFVDAGLSLIRDAAGQISAVEVTWRYDELYSLILLEDYGLDQDFDMALTATEVTETLGFDLNWSGGFTGGLVLMQGDHALTLGPPVAVSMVLLAEGQIETVHRRPVIGAAPGDLVAQVYDPEFYVAFEMTLAMDAVGCTPDLIRPDLDDAYAVLDAAMAEIGGAVAAEDNFPAVGAVFADKVVFQCAP